MDHTGTHRSSNSKPKHSDDSCAISLTVTHRLTVRRYAYSTWESVFFISLVILATGNHGDLMSFRIADAIKCTWDFSLTDEERIAQNCGYKCPDPWGKVDPHYCGPPHPCCCDPKCDVQEAKKTSFFGINWSDKYMRLRPDRKQQFETLKRNGFYHIKTFSPDGLVDIYDTFGDEAKVYMGIPNNQLTELASDNVGFIRNFLVKNVIPFNKIIKLVIVGNEPLICIKTKDWAKNSECGFLNIPAKLVPAMRNLKKHMLHFELHQPVTTAFNGGIMDMDTNPWTPCIADYRESTKPILREVWDFLYEQKPQAPFIVNLYSWFATLAGHLTPSVSVGYPVSNIPSDGRHSYYFNFDMQHDLQRIAMCKNNVTHLDLWIGETGWPTDEHDKATTTNAWWYTRNAVLRVQGSSINNPKKDTARFKYLPYVLFGFEAFDEQYKFEIEHGNRFENSFGLFYEDLLPKWSSVDGLLDLPLPLFDRTLPAEERQRNQLHLPEV